ncbi:MAG: putative DNA binding domain-containing protein [Lachnospiraceae bacterium]|nr:putative DNA binding domain-containing protein [Lachnospiraceae bacterium]
MNLGIETETLEYKKSTGELKEAVQSMCAILNKHQHGELYFGVKSDGTPIGQVVTEESMREVSQKIKNSIEPKIYPEISKVVLDGRDCIYVKFEGNQTPYFANGVARIRVADEDLVMSPEQITELLLRSGREGNRWENLRANKTIDDVDEDLLKKYTAQAHEVGRIAITYTDKRTVLNQLELTDGNSLLNAGKALFSDDILQDVQMAIFATNERLTFNDIQRHHGPILKLVDIAENYIRSNIHWRVEFTGELQRKEIPEIPADAIREALLNSFCHKDYASGQSNEVAIYKDRVEIYNPGAFPEGYDPQDFIDRAERPIRRNPKIARMLYYSKDIESFGTGLKRIAEACEDAGVRYEFKKMKSGFVVCFYRTLEKNDKSTDKVRISTDKIRKNMDKLSPAQMKIVEYLLDEKRVTNKEVQQLLGVKDSRALKIIKELVDIGLIVKHGKLKGSYYVLNENEERRE